MTIVMKGYEITVIFINTRRSDNRTTEIAADIFDNLVAVTFVGLGIKSA